MGSASADRAGVAAAGDLLLAIVAERGSAAHPYARSDMLLRGSHAGRNLADVTHFLCVVHGGHPGAIDHAVRRVGDTRPYRWLQRAAEVFAVESAFLVRLAAVAGSPPGTPASADSDAVAIAQTHAIEMLACSERNGCALGAATALVLDWAVIRKVLNSAAERFGIDAPAFTLADQAEIADLAASAAANPAIQRALLFGAEQVSAQHHGLWDLLEARQESRDAREP